MAIRLKICGVTRAEDLAACVELGVDAGARGPAELGALVRGLRAATSR